jgi:hypothetical protein
MDFPPDPPLVEAPSLLEEQTAEAEGERLLDVSPRHRQDGSEHLRRGREVSPRHVGGVHEGPVEVHREVVPPRDEHLPVLVLPEVGGCPSLDVDGRLATLHADQRPPLALTVSLGFGLGLLLLLFGEEPGARGWSR